MIDENRHRARHVVAELHASADRATGKFAELLREAACLLDGYQAGLQLATPHPATGYALVTHEQRALILDTENQSQQEAA